MEGQRDGARVEVLLPYQNRPRAARDRDLAVGSPVGGDSTHATQRLTRFRCAVWWPSFDFAYGRFCTAVGWTASSIANCARTSSIRFRRIVHADCRPTKLDARR